MLFAMPPLRMITRLNGEASARLVFRSIWELGAKDPNDHLTSLPFIRD